MNGNLELECWYCGNDIDNEQPLWVNDRAYHSHCRAAHIHQLAMKRRTRDAS